MKHGRPALALLPLLVFLVGLVASPAAAPAARPAKGPSQKEKKGKTTVFEVCRHGCRYRAVQKAVEAAGRHAFRHKGAKVTVAVGPGTYVEGVLVDGTERGVRFDGLTIAGTKKDPKRAVLEGNGATGPPGAAQNGIEAVGVDGLVIKNLWARNFAADGFLVHADPEARRGCSDYTMDNLLASGNGSNGLAAEGCLGGRITNSAGFRQGDAGFAVAATPCDALDWSVYGSDACQAEPRATLLKDDRGYGNALGFSGPDSRYLRIIESAFYDNGVGIVVDSVAGTGHEPSGWNLIEHDDVFWNNFNFFLGGEAGAGVAAGLGALDGRTINYPTGTGIVLYGSDGSLVRGNRVFGNYKWGIASFSGPGETLVADPGNEAKNVDNEIVENLLGRGGADPNGEYDFWNDGTGAGNCWGANSPNSTFAPGNGKAPLSQIYPDCPQPEADYATARSVNAQAGLQTNGPPPNPPPVAGGAVVGVPPTVAQLEATKPSTVLGYTGTNPPQDQQCSWTERVSEHPAFQAFEPFEATPRPGELSC